VDYLKTVLAKLGLEGTNHEFRHSFCTIAVLAGVDFFTLRRWVGHFDEDALKIYVHIADEQAQMTMWQLAERRQAAGSPAKPARGRQGFSNVVPRWSRDWWWFSKVTEGNDDSLFKKPWILAGKQGTFASTFCTKRRGRDSNPRSSF